MSTERRCGRKHELAIGARYGRLVVTQTRPGLVMRCDCGATVSNRTPAHVAVSRVRSCGCGKRKAIS